MARRRSRPARIVPEIVQSSAMDCGPASLKAILDGFGMPVSYGRLREACQTELDGTSIDTLERVAVQLGLDAEQVMVPADHLLLAQAKLLPALVVVRLPSGVTHYVVAWNCIGPWVQVMDPATGRHWKTKTDFVRDLFVHTFPVPASDWYEWASSEDFLLPLRVMMGKLGVRISEASRLVDLAVTGGGWRQLAALDATTRMVGSLVRSGGLRRGREASSVLVEVLENELHEQSVDKSKIPPGFWSVLPAPRNGEQEMLNVRGAVLVRFRGFRAEEEEQTEAGADDELPEALRAAIEETPRPPLGELWRHLRRDGLLPPAFFAVGAAIAAMTVMVEGLLFRGLLDLGRFFGFAEQRVGAAAAVIALLMAVLLLAVPEMATLIRLGRHLEIRLRMTLQSKIPRLSDRYFHSRLSSDMAERAHAVHRIRSLPVAVGSIYRLTCFMIATVGGIIWLDPSSAPVAIAAAGVSVGLPLISQRFLTEKDLRVRTHVGALTRFFLDALLGLTTLRCHSAERAVRREHEALLTEWARSSLELLRSVVRVEGIVTLTGFAAAIWVLYSHLSRSGEAGMALLLVYWVLSLPSLGQEIAVSARSLPSLRNIALRLIEPLGAPEEEGLNEEGTGQSPPLTEPVAISFSNMKVRSGGHVILEDINLAIEAGSHIAVVGSSGAGKSSLVGVLLGWHRPTEGSVRIDNVELDGPVLRSLRRHTAWIDPDVQIWNRSFVENLYYGCRDDMTQPAADTLRQAGLYEVVERLPDGLQTLLGEGGGLLSGGEGQRVRLGRAFNQSEVRLAILDEPFRGLDRRQRGALLGEAREHFAEATLICVTHDIRETTTFDHVVVIDDGRIVEHGPTHNLVKNPTSRYRQLLAAEEALHNELWRGSEWRRLTICDGKINEQQHGGGS